ILAAASAWPRQERKRALIAGGRERVETRHNVRQRCIPRDLLELPAAPGAASFERMREAIGVIGDLNGGLSARTEPPLIDRMSGIAFELLRDAHLHDAALAVARHLHVGFHHAHEQAATRLTRMTDA